MAKNRETREIWTIWALTQPELHPRTITVNVKNYFQRWQFASGLVNNGTQIPFHEFSRFPCSNEWRKMLALSRKWPRGSSER